MAVADPPATQLVDCQVDCGAPRPQSLAPHVSEQWREYITSPAYRGPGTELVYPDWASGLGGAHERDVEDYRRFMDQSGIAHALVHAYYAVEGFTHPYLAAELATGVNRWLAAEWLDRDGRLSGGAGVTPQHPRHAVTEIERVARDPRFVTVMVPARSQAGYGDERYWPIWEAANAAGMVVTITHGGVSGSASTPVGWPATFLGDYASAPLAHQSQVASLIFSGVFEMFPNLRFTIAGSGWTWAPMLLWRMDQAWKAFTREVPWLAEPPSSYARRHFRFTTGPTDGPPTIDALRQLVGHLGDGLQPGSDFLLYSSDYPREGAPTQETVVGWLGDEKAAAVLGGTALAWYPRVSQ